MRNAVSAEDGDGIGRDFVQVFNETRAFRLQAIDDITIVDDLVAHVDRPLARGECALHDIDGSDNARAKATRLRQNYFHAETPVLRCATAVFRNPELRFKRGAWRAGPEHAVYQTPTLRAKYADMDSRQRAAEKRRRRRVSKAT
jgi:hypothetical protein